MSEPASRFLPGHDYVPVFCRTLAEPKVYNAQVRSPRTCEHVISVCITCVTTWEMFWDIHYHRTRAGRRLARKMEVLRATGEMVGLSPRTAAQWRTHWARGTDGPLRVDVVDGPGLPPITE